MTSKTVVFIPFEGYERNGTYYPHGNRNTLRIRSMLRFPVSVGAILCVASRAFEKLFGKNKECGFHSEKGLSDKSRIFTYITFRPLIADLLKTVEPKEVANRRQCEFRRRHFWVAGVNDVWPQDQHDKWGRFGLWLHAGIEAFSGEINWIKIWWTNKNPQLIAGFYLDNCRQIGGTIPSSCPPGKTPN